MISKEGIEITNRFFEAIEILKSQNKIKGLHTFTTKFNINRRNLQDVRKNPDVKILKPDIISYLVTEYDVSAEWILTGRGEPLKSTKCAKSVQIIK